MKNLVTVCTLFCLTLWSCDKQPEQPPVPIDKMGNILLDIQLAETYSMGIGPDSTKSRFNKNYDSLEVFYSAILKHYHLSFAKFNEALNWYKQRPIQADSLLSLVLDGLHVTQSEFHIPDEEKPEQKKKVPDRMNVQPQANPFRPAPLDTSLNKKSRDSLLKIQLPKPPELSTPNNE